MHLTRFMILAKAITTAVIVFAVMIAAGCGDDTDRTFFTGTISNSTGAALPANIFRETNDTAGIDVCAFGNCDTTDSSGGYGFNIEQGQFTGGDILFSISGRGLDTTALATNVPNAEFVTVNFTVRPDGSVEITLVDTSGSANPPPVVTEAPETTAVPEATATTIPDTVPTADPTATPDAVAPPQVTATPSASGACAELSGTYSGSGGCQIGSLSVSSADDSSVSFAPFGANDSAAFETSGDSGTSTSSDLVLFGAGGHSCDIECNGADSFTISCSNPDGGSCTESFSK